MDQPRPLNKIRNKMNEQAAAKQKVITFFEKGKKEKKKNGQV